MRAGASCETLSHALSRFFPSVHGCRSVTSRRKPCLPIFTSRLKQLSLHWFWQQYALASEMCGVTARPVTNPKFPYPCCSRHIRCARKLHPVCEKKPGNRSKSSFGEPRVGLGAAATEAGGGSPGGRGAADQAAVRAADGGAGGADEGPHVFPQGSGGGQSARAFLENTCALARRLLSKLPSPFSSLGHTATLLPLPPLV